MWHVLDRFYLGDYRSGEEALGGAERPVPPDAAPAPFAGVVSLCPMPLVSDDNVVGPLLEQTEWLLIPILDGGNGEEEFVSAISVARPFVRRRLEAGNVLVHCAAGMSRSVCLLAALLCERGDRMPQVLRHIAEAKARALYPFAGDPDDLIAPAWEFVAALERLYSEFDARRASVDSGT
jgi:hypothetical protein